MREAIGGTWLTQLVIVIMFIFVAFLALSINYSKAFRVKNEVISIIEKKEGITQNNNANGSIFLINKFLANNGYNTVGKCEVGSYGFLTNNVTATLIDNRNKNNKYNYCISKTKSITTNFPNRSYYKVKLFFKFNLPIVGDVYTFKVDGETKDITFPKDGTCGANDSVKCVSSSVDN